MDTYKYTIDMATGFRQTARHIFQKFIGQPICHLEIGVYEGLSGCFMLENILTHPQAKYFGIDPYEPQHKHAYQTAIENFKRHYPRAYLIPDFSYNILPNLAKCLFDTIYVDGCHSYQGCKLDIEQCWPLLKPGGIILCDDYNRDDYGVKQAVLEFLDTLPPSQYDIIYKDYQIGWTKL